MKTLNKPPLSLAQNRRLSLFRLVLVSLFSGLSSVLLRQVLQAGEPLYHVMPYGLFLIPYLCRLAPYLWRDPDHVLPAKATLIPIREIAAKDFTYSRLQDVSENFYYPVVVRDLFRNSPAVARWSEDGYLARRLGEYKIRTNFCDAYNDVEDKVETFEDAFLNLLHNEDSKKCLLFPNLSRPENKTTIHAFKNDVTQLVREDLYLDQIRPGFASDTHTNVHGCQMIAGRGIKHATTKNFTGLGWHAEPGTNWYAQVVGRKKWFFLDPKHTSLMIPFFETTATFRTSDMAKMNELHDRMPLHTVDLEPGDLLVNPDWWFHRTSAYHGLSMSVAIREVVPKRVFRNNPILTMAVSRFYLLKIGLN